MAFRKVLAGFLMVMMAYPVWGSADVVGNITSSNDATVRETKLPPGSTVFSGDEISVGVHGATRIAFANGAQAEVLGNSVVRLTKADNRIQMRVDRGQASIHTSGGKDMETLVADASIRAADSGETSAIIQALSEKHAVIAAQKGALFVTTAFDGKTYTVREGEAADLSVAPDPQQNGGAIPTGKGPWFPCSNNSNNNKKKKCVFWVVAIVSATVAITAYLLERREKAPPPIANEISPAKLN